MTAVLTDKRRITPRDTLYTLECPEIAGSARPGQFVELKVNTGYEPFFRRPFSVFGVGGRSFQLLVRTVGTGTALMSEWEPGRRADVIGPLGNGFSWSGDERSFILAGGGVGAAPLNLLAEALLAEGKRVSMLFSPERDRALLDAFSVADRISISFSPDRTALPDAVEAIISECGRPDRIFACGPDGFLKAVVGAAGKHGVRTQVSMEQYMCCGTGICLGCVIPVRSDSGAAYKKVCSDGPVFPGEEVIFE